MSYVEAHSRNTEMSVKRRTKNEHKQRLLSDLEATVQTLEEKLLALAELQSEEEATTGNGLAGRGLIHEQSSLVRKGRLEKSGNWEQDRARVSPGSSGSNPSRRNVPLAVHQKQTETLSKEIVVMERGLARPQGLVSVPGGVVFSDKTGLSVLLASKSGETKEMMRLVKSVRSDYRGLCLGNGEPSRSCLDILGCDLKQHQIKTVTLTPANVDIGVLAGSGKRGFKDGHVTIAQFNQPNSICQYGKNKYIVADTGNNSIRVIRDDSIVTTLAGGVKSANGRMESGYCDGAARESLFRHPTDVLQEKTTGTIFVVDQGNDCIRSIEFEPQRTFTSDNKDEGDWVVHTFAKGFCSPTSITQNETGDLFIADANGIHELNIKTKTMKKLSLSSPFELRKIEVIRFVKRHGVLLSTFDDGIGFVPIKVTGALGATLLSSSAVVGPTPVTKRTLRNSKHTRKKTTKQQPLRSSSNSENIPEMSNELSSPSVMEHHPFFRKNK